MKQRAEDVFPPRLKRILRNAKEEYGLDYRSVASELGISLGALSNYANGVQVPNICILKKISEFFGVSADWLLALSDHGLSALITADSIAGKRLVDANEIIDVAERSYDAWNLAMATADGAREINMIYKKQELCKAVKVVADAALTVEVVEVVRCKDCKNYKKGFCTIRKDGWGATLTVAEHDFCSDGERMENDKRIIPE